MNTDIFNHRKLVVRKENFVEKTPIPQSHLTGVFQP
jgi:hypothetical protein